MALLPILTFPDPRLHKVAAPVTAVDAHVQRIVADMLETMYAAEGIGLAATQVDIHQRIIVMDTSEQRDQPLVLINPELIARSPERVVGDEGCLSVPGLWYPTHRAWYARVVGTDLDGNEVVVQGTELMARCLQHEMDHLMGKVFVEYLSPLKRNRIKTKLQKEERELRRDKQALDAR